MARKERGAASEKMRKLVHASEFFSPDEYAGLVRNTKTRGRPKLLDPKQRTTLYLDSNVMEYFKAGGPGYQTRINEALAKVVAAHAEVAGFATSVMAKASKAVIPKKTAKATATSRSRTGTNARA